MGEENNNQVESNNNEASRLKTKEQRSQIATEAAKKRWAKQKRMAKQAVKAKAAAKAATAAKKTKVKVKVPREFSSARKVAERQLAKAFHDRDEAAAKYAVAIGQIPSLMAIIRAFDNPSAPDYGYTAPLPPSLEQVMSDQPLAYANPPRSIPAQPPVMPVPQQLHPANQTASRAQGGAIDVALDEDEDENKFLNESSVSGGQWR